MLLSLSDNDEIICCKEIHRVCVGQHSALSALSALCTSYIAQTLSKSLTCYFICHVANFVKISCKHINFDGRSNSLALILNFRISECDVHRSISAEMKISISYRGMFFRNLSVKEF